LTSSTPAASSSSISVFVQHVAGGDQHSAVLGMQHVFGHGATQDTVAQGFDHFTAFDDGAHHVSRWRCRNRASVTTKSCVTSTKRRVR
jgi:hypothetical protein